MGTGKGNRTADNRDFYYCYLLDYVSNRLFLILEIWPDLEKTQNGKSNIAATYYLGTGLANVPSKSQSFSAFVFKISRFF